MTDPDTKALEARLREELRDIENAPREEGPRAYYWRDKPHRELWRAVEIGNSLFDTIATLRQERDLEAKETARLTRERDRERKHVSKIMEERDHARKALDNANRRIRELKYNPSSDDQATLELCKLALEHASHALDGVVALDDEDEDKNGASATCQHAKKTVDRALTKVVALSAKIKDATDAR